MVYPTQLDPTGLVENVRVNHLLGVTFWKFVEPKVQDEVTVKSVKLRAKVSLNCQGS